MVELCKGRLSILQLDEETLLEEAKDLNIEKLRISIKQVLIRSLVETCVCIVEILCVCPMNI